MDGNSQLDSGQLGLPEFVNTLSKKKIKNEKMLYTHKPYSR